MEHYAMVYDRHVKEIQDLVTCLNYIAVMPANMSCDCL